MPAHPKTALLLGGLLLLSACAYSDERLFSESGGVITVSSSGAVQQASQPEAPENAPLVIIRFDQPEVDYGAALGQILERARAKRPDAGFDLVAVSPSIGSEEEVAAKRRAARDRGTQVFSTMEELGVPREIMTLASTVSPAVTVNEVHIYLR
ncbi:hypothetical protein [Limibacillus halophilus]|jgi:FAD/FMN-containing dehydrogenase